VKRLTLVLVLVAGTIAIPAANATGAKKPVVISFVKHKVGEGHYAGTTSDGGTLDMWMSDSSVVGDAQYFTATFVISARQPGHSFTAVLRGSFDFNTLRTELDGRVTDGWREGASAHEEGELTQVDPLTFEGSLTLVKVKSEND
jgi:hypothetical protein